VLLVILHTTRVTCLLLQVSEHVQYIVLASW